MKPFYVTLKPYLDNRLDFKTLNWSAVFGNQHPIEVEIGFGNGEYLARISQEKPEVNFLGFEEYCQRIHRTLRKLSRNNIHNTKVFRLDVRPGLKYYFKSKSISYIHCLYPPPWPKKSDSKHRLFTTDFLRLANNRLINGGTLKIVTDHFGYMDWIMENIAQTGFEAQLKTVKANYDTKFERKWKEAGQSDFKELLLVKKEHIEVPAYKEEEVQHYQLDQFNPQEFKMADYSKEGIAVVFKDYLYDPIRKIAMVHVLVNDEHIFQNIRIVIFQTEKGWQLNLAEGTMQMPTAGVSKALELVFQAAKRG